MAARLDFPLRTPDLPVHDEAATHILPLAVRNWLTVTEVDDGAFFAGELFRYKYAQTLPDFGRHVVAFYRNEDGTYRTLSYLHFWRQGRIGLIGGGCTDGRVMRAIPAPHAAQINAIGGVLRYTLLYAFSRFAGDIDAFFGHAGDARAREVDLAAGFIETDDKHLLIRPARVLKPAEERALFEQALALGNF